MPVRDLEEARNANWGYVSRRNTRARFDLVVWQLLPRSRYFCLTTLNEIIQNDMILVSEQTPFDSNLEHCR